MRQTRMQTACGQLVGARDEEAESETRNLWFHTKYQGAKESLYCILKRYPGVHYHMPAR